MALQEVAVPIAFAGGVETKADRKMVPTARLLALENGVFSRSTSIIKRNGYEGLPRDLDEGGVYSAPKALAARGAELCLFADRAMFSYRSSTGTWSRIGPAESVVHTERPVAATGTDQSMPDMATHNGVSLVAWEDSRGGVWWSLVEQTTGRVIRPAEQANAAWTKPRCCRNGDALHLYAADEAQGRIWAVVVNLSSALSVAAPVIVVSDMSLTAPFYDATLFDDGERPVVMSWVTAAGFTVAYIDQSGSITSTPSPRGDHTSALDGPVAIDADPATSRVTVAGSVGTSVGAFDFAATDLPTLLTVGVMMVLASAPVRTALARIPVVGDVWLWAEEAGSEERFNMVSVAWAAGGAGGAIVEALRLLRGHGLVSRGFADDSAPCVVVAHEGVFFPYAAVVRGHVPDAATGVPALNAVGRLLVGSSDGLPTRRHLANVVQDPDDERVWRWPGLARELVEVATGASQFTETGIRIATLDFDSRDAYQVAEFGRDLVVAGAMPLRYDGDTVAELSFHTAPEGVLGASTGLVVGAMAPGSYLYFAVYEEVDAQGVIHPGAPSVGTLVTIAGPDTAVLVAVPTYHLTSKRRVRIGVFRTEVNDTSGDSPAAYRVTSLDPSVTGALTLNAFMLNDTTVDGVTFIDGMSDAVLITREPLYTNNVFAPGVLANDPVGLGAVVATGKDRLFFSDPTDGSVVRYTQARREGYGPEVSADLSLPVDPYGGDVTALAVLDDAVIVFKSGAIYGFAGPGPLPNPDAAPQVGFSQAQLITSDVGCTSPASLAVTPVGVMFKTARGIYLLSRERQVSYVGAPVEAYNGQRIVSANALPGRTQIVFLTDEGVSLLFDYYHGQWSWFTNHEGLDAVVAGGVYHYVRASSVDLRVFRETPGAYLDGTNEIRLYLKTAWVKFQQYAQGWQKLWFAHFLGEWLSAHALAVGIAIDYRDDYGAPYILDVDTNNDPAAYGEGDYGDGPYGGDGDTIYQRRIHVGLKCQAVSFEIYDQRSVVAPTTPLGPSFELSELLLTGGVMKPGVKLGANRST